jgi:hypothetical protein
MRTPRILARVFALSLLLAGLGAQQTVEIVPVLEEGTAAAIRNEGMENSRVMEYLKELTELSVSGGRLTGSDNYTAACYWALEKFQEMGLAARLEPWGQWNFAWNRGAWHGRVISPVPMELFVATQAWTAGTAGMERGPLLPMPESAEVLVGLGERANGAFLFGPMPRGGIPGEMRDAAKVSGVAGFVYPATGSPDYPNRVRVFGSNRPARGSAEDLPTIPEIAVRADDAAKLVELLSGDEPPMVEFNIQNSFREGPVVLYNVVGEIRGATQPDEVVIVCGHLDSWHQATGATDNGTGVTSALEAARILAAVGTQPARTIRFIFWGGEEQGLLGSREYVRQHSDELAGISAVFNHDTGTNWAQSMTVAESQFGAMQRVVGPVFFLEAPDAGFDEPIFQLRSRESIGGGRGGSDHASFLSAGVPAFSWGLTGRADYFNYSWHTQWDTYDAAIPEYQRHTSTVIALVALGTANLPELLDRAGINPSRGGRGARGSRGGLGNVGAVLNSMFGAEMDGLRFGALRADGVAAKAGIREGDVLKSINGRAVEQPGSIFVILVERPRELKLVLQRGEAEVEVSLDPAGLVPGRRGRRGGR